MVVCHCMGLNSQDILDAARRLDNPTCTAVLRESGACRGCGSCAPNIVTVLATMKPQESEEGTQDAPEEGNH